MGPWAYFKLLVYENRQKQKEELSTLANGLRGDAIEKIMGFIPEDKMGKIGGIARGSDLFYKRAAEIFYFESMSRTQWWIDRGYIALDALLLD